MDKDNRDNDNDNNLEDEFEYDDDHMPPDGFYDDGEPESDAQFFWRQYYAEDGKEF